MEKGYLRAVCLFCCQTLSNDIVHTVENKHLLQKFINIVEQLRKKNINRESLINNRFLQCCLNCLDTVRSISNLFHELKCVELKLEWKLRTLTETITHTGNKFEVQPIFKKLLDTGDMRYHDHDQDSSCQLQTLAAKFRKDLVQLFSRFQSPYPKIILNKCDARPAKSYISPISKNNFNTKSTVIRNTTDGVSLILVLWLLDVLKANKKKDLVERNKNPSSKNGFSQKAVVKVENSFDDVISKEEFISPSDDLSNSHYDLKSNNFVETITSDLKSCPMSIDGRAAQDENPLVFNEFKVNTKTETDCIFRNEQIETTKVFPVKFEKTNSNVILGKDSPKSVRPNGQQHQLQKKGRPALPKQGPMRKRAQNRKASNRYRMKEKMQWIQTQSELECLQQLNDALIVNVEKLKMEIKTIRCLLRERLQARTTTLI